jgi:glycosyltransferase involved in cell wall biosynthesis
MEEDSRPLLRPVRVCFVIDRLCVAGTETQLLKLINGLDRNCVLPHLCLLDGEDETSRSLEPADCPVIRLGVRRLRHPSTVRQAWRFARYLRRERIDVVQTHFPDSLYFAAPVARLAGVPHVLRTRRDLGFWMKPADRWLAPLYSHIVTGTIANCEACRRAVIEQERVSPDSVVVLENGIELSRLMDIPLPSPTGNGKKSVVGMVANLRPVKGPDVFLRAAAMVSKRNPHTAFRIAGSGDVDSARRLIRELGLSRRVELVGSVRDVPALLGELDVAVLTSHSEGLSNALLEYMAAGRPIVATAVGGNVELIEDGVHGLLVPPGNADAAAEAIARLLADREFASALGAAARERAGEHYSTGAMLRRHEGFYTTLVHRE